MKTVAKPLRTRPELGGLDGLDRFLRFKGSTLLIKGYAGAGKTTLATLLLERFGGGVYVSSRVSEDKVHAQLPLMKQMMPGPEFVDVRLDLPLSTVAKVIEVTSQRKDDVPLLILDTWDGMAKELEDKERLKAEKTLIALADGSNTRVVFVSEEPGKSTMDYLVDGMVELVRSEEKGRVFREIEIQKLRGTPIVQHKYLYTLLGGRFAYIPPYEEPDYSKAKKPAARRDFDKSTYSFGSEAFDSIFRGLKRGTAFTLEYSEDVPYSAIRLLHIPLIINFLNMGRSCLMIPLLGASVEEILSVIRPHVTGEAITKRLRMATVEPSDGSALKPPLFGMGRGKVDNEHANFSKVAEELAARSVDGNVVIVDSMSFLENLFASDREGLIEAMADRIIATQRHGNALLLILQSDSPIKSRMLSMSQNYLRLFMKDRAVVLVGEKPATEAYVLDHADNPLMPRLTRIV
ncbi:MAG: hypothetical protein JRN39_02105 [Nitrososphaerota archaeon]|nr:hypothetical protein [Nitrososphaerota archaeon]